MAGQQRDRIDRAISRWLRARHELAPDHLRRMAVAWSVLTDEEKELLTLHYTSTATADEKADQAGLCKRAFYERIDRAKYRVVGALAMLAEAAQAA